MLDDENRVRLKNQENDYINATHWKVIASFGFILINLLQLKGLNTQFIATQAPLSSTIVDFWKMVEQENCTRIISLIKSDYKVIKLNMKIFTA